MELNKEESQAVKETITMMGVISEMAGKPSIFTSILMALKDKDPEVALLILFDLEQFAYHTDNNVKLHNPRMFREFMTDAIINLGQVHLQLLPKFNEFALYSEEMRRIKKDFLAVEFGEVLIEPETFAAFKKVMFKLGGGCDANMVN